jgi:protein-S-isoprenylcysteine O-methyltransferase Ste14
VSALIAMLLLQTAVMTAVFAGLLFASAGTLDWPQAWAFLVLMAACSLAVGFWLARRDPDLLRERMGGIARKDQAGWDRVFMPIVLVTVIAWMLLMGFEHRLHGAAFPPWVQALGALGIVGCMAASCWVFAVNSYATSVVKLQKEQKAITTGPYAYVRHPMYASAIGFMFGLPLLLGSVWGLPVGAFLIVAIGWRAVGEEKVLVQGLKGYPDYMAKVRWRLVPGIW